MARRKATSTGSPGSPAGILQLVTGVYLVMLGISELIAYNSEINSLIRSVSRAFGGGGDVMTIVVAVLEILAGLFLLWALVGSVPARTVFLGAKVIALLWIVRVVIVLVLNDPLEPTGLVWVTELCGALIPGLGIWVVANRYR